MTLEADSPCGSAVFFELPGLVSGDGEATVVTTPASGSWFPTGTTEVTVVATNAAGHRAECRFPVILTGDFAAPSLAGVLPARVPEGGTGRVSLRGVGFLPGDEVRVGGLAAVAPAWLEPGEITLVPPALPPGTHDVSVWRCAEQVATLPAGLTVEPGMPELLSARTGVP